MPRDSHSQKNATRNKKRDRESGLNDIIKATDVTISNKPLPKKKRRISKATPLTPGEVNFVFELTRSDAGRPKNATIAYMRAFNIAIPPSGPLHPNHKMAASNLKKKPNIEAAIAGNMADLQRDTRKRNRNLHRKIQERLWEEGNDLENPPSTRVTALKSLADLIGPESQEDEQKDNAANLDDLKAQLLDALESSGMSAPMEVEAEVITKDDVIETSYSLAETSDESQGR